MDLLNQNQQYQINKYIRFLALGLGYSIQNFVWSCIPIIFYRPDTMCEILDPSSPLLQNFQCNEFTACKSQQYSDTALFFQKPQYEQLYSVSMEFDLFCDRKILEANILSIGMIGQAFGALFAFFFRVESHQQQLVFIYQLILQTILFLWANFATSLVEVTIIFFGWNVISNFYLCLIYTHVNQSFEGQLKKYGTSLLNIIWTASTIIFIIVTISLGNWRYNIGMFLCMLNVMIVLALVMTRDYNFDTKSYIEFQAKRAQNNNNNTEQITRAHNTHKIIADLRESCIKIHQSPIFKNNAYLWGLNMMAGTIAYYIVALVLNTLVGDLYLNNVGCSTLELIAQLLSGVLIYLKIDLKKTLVSIFYIIGFAYISCIVFQDSSDRENQQDLATYMVVLKLLPIIIGKATHECLWTILYTYLPYLIPKELHQFTTAGAQLSTICICAIVPYYKFAMEYFGMNSFFILGVFCVYIGYQCKKYQEIEDPNLRNELNHKKDFEMDVFSEKSYRAPPNMSLTENQQEEEEKENE